MDTKYEVQNLELNEDEHLELVGQASSRPIVEQASSRPIVELASSRPIVELASSRPIVELASSQPIECLGMTFPNDEARREHFLGILKEKLKDPEFRKIEGFPIGGDEDILALSDPPYYTACPNPFIEDFIKFYGKPFNPDEPYSREPFAADVSEGKNDPIYNAHSYHTKVPHKAIMRYILHYTEPGDVVFDGFCGTGMTGVAAQLCGDKSVVESLGYKVEPDGTILDEQGKPFSKLGARKAVLNDLSPAATFIAYNYNTPVDVQEFEKEAKRILKEVEDECGWMYETLHVEPASIRLIKSTGFAEPVEQASNRIPVEQASSRLPVESASSRLFKSSSRQKSRQDNSSTGISEFTIRKDNLPHWQLPGAFYFITFDTAINKKTGRRRVLSDEAKTIVLNSLKYWDNQRLNFIAAVVMPDHVHAVIQPLPKSAGPASSRTNNDRHNEGNSRLEAEPTWDLKDIMHSIKSFSANEINKIENSIGETVWQSEYYDRIIRNDKEYGYVLQYIAYNPVKESLAKDPESYRWLEFSNSVMKAGWKPAPRGRINYTVWSDVFVCPECAKEVIFWDAAVNKEEGKVNNEFPCPGCTAKLTKRNMERAWITKFDKAINKTIKQAKQVPVLINYSVGNKRYEKVPDQFDLDLIKKIEEMDIPYWFPTDRMPEGYNTEQPKKSHGITHVHHFYTKRNLRVLGNFALLIKQSKFYMFWLSILKSSTSYSTRCVKINVPRLLYKGGLFSFGAVTGTLYIPSIAGERPIIDAVIGKMASIKKIYSNYQEEKLTLTTTNSSTFFQHCLNSSLDYIFTDPPFGGNLMYSELNFLWESWLKVFTNNKTEAIENKVQGKGMAEYQEIMTKCFQEYYRVLKPGRWMTVEFHNSKNSVWNAIQEALQHAGFVIADVRTLDKQQGSFKQVTSNAATKQDLIISAYKPNGGLEERFKLKAGTEDGVWDFLRTHLKQLPIFVSKTNKSVEPASSRLPIESVSSRTDISRQDDGSTIRKTSRQDDGSTVRAKNGWQDDGSTMEIIAERQNYLLFDRMVAFHVQRGVFVPMSAAEFYLGLKQRFSERDGMYFLPEQVVEYDKKRITVKEVRQLPLFVKDEESAIQWLRQQLDEKPQTFQEIHPQFIRELSGWLKHEKSLELSELLAENFLRYEGAGEVPSQIHAYLSSNYKDLRNLPKDDHNLKAKAKDRWFVPDPNKAGDLEKLRERSLLKEFKEYLDPADPASSRTTSRQDAGSTKRKRKLKVFRLEAVRAGFKKAWQEKDYKTIIDVSNKIPENVLQEDPKLLMWYDQALTRMGG